MLARQINVKNPEARRVVILSYTYKMRPYKKAGREDSDD